MGQIASDGVNNLAYYSRKPPITTPQQNELPSKPSFDANKTYIALVIGDGDSIKHMKRWSRGFLLDRIQRCDADPSYKGCFPLLWSLSPNLRFLAPDWLRWYYDQARQTSRDFFVLPPSGDLYSYPAEMRPAEQARYVANTERDAMLMNTSAMVEWEMLDTWPQALKGYYPRYAARGVVRSLMLVNVPYMLPVWLFKKGEFYRVLEGGGDEHKHPIVMFKPREWRGTSSNTSKQTLTVAAFANEINGYVNNHQLLCSSLPASWFCPSSADLREGHKMAFCLAYMLASRGVLRAAHSWNRYPPGTVMPIYMTTDGGLLPADDKPLHNPYDLVAQVL
jgi:hypothetical protein